MLLLLFQFKVKLKPSTEQTLVAFSGRLAATGASRMSRLQSQFVGPEHRARSLTSFQKAAARAPEEQDWSDLFIPDATRSGFCL